MNDQNLVSGKFSYKTTWQGAKDLCNDVRLEFFCMVFLSLVCGAILLVIFSFLFPSQEHHTSVLTIQAIVQGLIQNLFISFIVAYFTLYITQLFLSRNKPPVDQYAYKISLKDVVVVTLMHTCAYVVIFSIALALFGFIHPVTPVAPATAAGFIIASIGAVIFMFIITIVVHCLFFLMVVRRVHAGESWLKLFRFSIKRFLRYGWRVLVMFLFVALIFMLLAVVLFAIQFVGSLLLHDILLSGGFIANMIVGLASIVAISVLLFILIRYYPIIAALPCSIYLCSYTADGVQPVSDDAEKDAAKLEK
jgi:hypothetical protein